MTTEKIVVFAIVGVVILAVLKNVNSINVTVVRVAVMCIVFMSVLPDVTELLSVIKSISASDGISSQSIKILFKVFVVLSLGALGADVCRDNGEGAIATVVEMASKVTAISLCIPVITAVISVAIGFLV